MRNHFNRIYYIRNWRWKDSFGEIYHFYYLMLWFKSNKNINFDITSICLQFYKIRRRIRSYLVTWPLFQVLQLWVMCTRVFMFRHRSNNQVLQIIDLRIPINKAPHRIKAFNLSCRVQENFETFWKSSKRTK